jgi:hypothetical protein
MFFSVSLYNQKYFQMKKLVLLLFIVSSSIYSCKNNDTKNTDLTSENKAVTEEAIKQKQINIIPLSHATGILEYDDYVIYIDPTGGAERFENQKTLTHVLVTDIHGDHLSLKTLEALNLSNASFIAPQAVADKLPENIV